VGHVIIPSKKAVMIQDFAKLFGITEILGFAYEWKKFTDG
jgi:hypothetical protein